MKLTKAKIKELKQEHLKYNKSMRQSHQHDEQLSFEQYVNYCFGKPVVKAKKEFKEYVSPQVMTRDLPQYPSLDTGTYSAYAKESPKYTGDLVIGISQTHKSNAVPVINKEQIVDIGHMRR